MMKNVTSAILIGAVLLMVISCSLVDKLASGGQELTKVGSLWPDVPPMEGMSPSETEMPVGTKLILRTIIGNLGLLNKNGESQATGDIDWTSFSGSKTPADVRNFYTNDKMSSFGKWAANKASACIDGKDKGLDGVFCVFQKEIDKRQVGLVIVAIQDEQTKKTDVYYLRIEADNASPSK